MKIAGTEGDRVQAILLLLAALALRVWDFGNPVIHVDEQYYLLVGDRMLGGAVPYVDLWDRKPIGLFLHFAAIRLLPGNGVLAYQLAAMLFAAATAWVVARGAARVGADARGQVAAGVIYLIALSLLGGRGGQSPVFYNLYVAIGGWLTLGLPTLAAAGRRRAIVASGAAACLLAGVAIQCKYTPAVEGAVFGCAHLFHLRRAGAGWIGTAGAGALWVALGVAPTLAAAGWYASQGALEGWWFANIVSIGLRPPYPADQIAMRLLGIAAQLLPLAVCVVLAWRRGRNAGLTMALVWLAGAVAGFLAIGTFFDHYALPLLAPLCVAAAPALGRIARARTAVLVLALGLFAVQRVRSHQDAAGAREVARLVRLNSVGGCPYVFMGDTITYHLAGACSPTAYAFPNLLAYSTERGATGIDEAAEVRRVLARRPPVVVGTTKSNLPWNRESLTIAKAVLARDYRPVFATPRGSWRTVIWLRRDRSLRR